MRFSRHGDLLRVVHITGPTHNVLGLDLAVASGPSPALTVEAPADSVPGGLAASDVESAVREGVRAASKALGLRVAVRRIQFVPSDSGPAGIYRDLAEALVRYYAAGRQSEEWLVAM